MEGRRMETHRETEKAGGGREVYGYRPRARRLGTSEEEWAEGGKQREMGHRSDSARYPIPSSTLGPPSCGTPFVWAWREGHL